MSKNHQTVIADSHVIPDLHRGTGYPIMLATNVAAEAEAGSAASVEPIYAGTAIRSTNFLQFCFKGAREPQISASFLQQQSDWQPVGWRRSRLEGGQIRAESPF